MRSLYKFFDRLENKVRAKLSHYPILYAFLGGIGVVIFWRGIWHTADFFTQIIFSFQQNIPINMGLVLWWDGPLSVIIGSTLLLLTGLFVFDFIGNMEIISGLKGEEKLAGKTEEEVKTETSEIGQIKEEIKEITENLKDIRKDLKK